MFGIRQYIKNWKQERRILVNREKLAKYDKEGYHRETLDPSKLIWTIFSKEFIEGDTIYWLGHDNVYGLLHGQTLTADKEAVEKRSYLNFWKKIDELDFEIKF
jgi:hypothetical protein